MFDSGSGGSGTVEMRRTADDGEDSVGAADWVIADNGMSRARGATTTWDAGGNPHKVGIFGYAKTGPAPPPASPENLKVASTDGEFEVDATWDATPGATSYRLTWLSVDGSGSLARNSGLPGDSLETAIPRTTATVSRSGLWEFWLTDCNDGGCGFPAIKTVEVKDLVLKQTPPSAVTGLRKASDTGGHNTCTRFAVQWNAPSDTFDSYLLTYGTGSTLVTSGSGKNAETLPAISTRPHLRLSTSSQARSRRPTM